MNLLLQLFSIFTEKIEYDFKPAFNEKTHCKHGFFVGYQCPECEKETKLNEQGVFNV